MIDLMSHSDVILGMHGAGWTNGLFVKRGAGALQLIPYGWVSDDGKTIRGYVHARHWIHSFLHLLMYTFFMI